jgi:transposase
VPYSDPQVRFRYGAGTAAPWVVPDELWDRLEPLLPRRERRFRHPGRKPLPDREVLCGILYVLHAGIQWQHLPKELGFGSGMTCWRRLRDWNETGVWQHLHEVLRTELDAAPRLDWSRCEVDTSPARALRGGGRRAPRR